VPSAERQNGPALFGRRYQVTIAPDVHQPAALQYGNVLENSAELRVTFDIKKDCTAKPNPGHIVIYNMATANRAVIEDGWAIQLQAGYKDTVQTIWMGQVGKGIAAKNPDLSTKDKASEKQEGNDISYAIETSEALGPMRLANMSKTYAKGVPYSLIWDNIITTMQASTPVTGFGVSIGSIPTPFPLGHTAKKIVLHGSCGDALDLIWHPNGYEWFVHNNQLSVVAVDEHTNDGIPYISKDTGLLGIPSRENGKSVSITCLLTPQLAPGRLLELDSDDDSFDGFYKVRSVQHRGDSHGENWESQVTCIPFPPIKGAPVDDT
jgi:hypothetical protein